MQNDVALEDCLDFILNRCSGKELDVVRAAVKRRQKNLKEEFSFDAEAVSKRISDEINVSIKNGVEGMADSIRQFSSNLITSEAPELSSEQVEALVDSWIPSFTENKKPISKSGKVNGIPTEFLYDMVLQFVSFGIGDMDKVKDEALKAEMGNWQEKYWKRFPKQIKQEVKIFFDGKTTYGTFIKSLRSLLNMSL